MLNDSQWCDPVLKLCVQKRLLKNVALVINYLFIYLYVDIHLISTYCYVTLIFLVLAPVLDDCLQNGSTPVLGPLWLSKGEGFSPKGVKEFLSGLIAYTKSKLKEAKQYQKQVRNELLDVELTMYVL